MAGQSRTLPVALAVGLSTLASPGVFAQGPTEIAAGSAVRITSPDRIEIPGVVKVSRGAIEGSFRRGDGGKFLTVVVEQRTLHLPMPGTRAKGRLVAADERTVTVLWDEEQRSIPREAIAKLEVRRHKGNVGTILGAVAGAGAGFFICHEQAESGWGAPLGIMCAVPGALLGGVAGSMAHPDWDVVAFDRLRVTVAPRPGGASAMLTFRF